MGSTLKAINLIARMDTSDVTAGAARVQGSLSQLETAAKKSENIAAQKSKGGSMAEIIESRYQASQARTAALDERYFQATHSQRDIELRDLQGFYAKQRELHAGNLQVLARLDKTYAAEAAALDARMGMQGGGAIGGKGFTQTREGRRAIKMMGVQAAGGLVGPELGEGLGMGMQASMMGVSAAGSVAVAGIAVGALAIAEGYKSAKAHAAGTLKIQQELNIAIREAKKALRPDPETTAEGGRIKEYISHLQGARDSFEKTIQQNVVDISTFGGNHPIEGTLKALGLNSIFSETQEAQAAAGKTTLMEQAGQREKRRAEAEKAQRTLADMERQPFMILREANALAAADRRKVLMDRRWEAQLAFEEDRDDKLKSGALSTEGAKKKTTAFGAIWDAKGEAFDIKEARDAKTRTIEAAGSLQDAKIRATEKGYDREKYLLGQKQSRETQLAKLHHENLGELETKHDAERMDLKTSRDDSLGDTQTSLQDKLFAAGGGSRHELEATQLERELKLRGATNEKVAKLVDLLKQAQAAGDNRALADAFGDLGDKLAVIHGTMTEVEAAAQRMMRSNPDMDPARARKLAGEQEHVQLAEQAKQLKESLHPLQAYAAYKKRLKKMQDAGELNPEDAKNLRLKFIDGTTPKSDAGRFESFEGRWKTIQSSLLQDNDPVARTIKDEFGKLRAEGLRLRAG
jgi:hypothetical protein